MSNYPKETYLYLILAAHDLTTRMIPECQNGEGLLGAILAEGIEDKDVIRIVADLFIGAGDTVSDRQRRIKAFEDLVLNSAHDSK